MSMRKLLDKSERLCLLRSIDECGGDANESILQDCLEMYGYRISRDAVRTHLNWLQEQGLITIEDLSGIFVASLTQRGDDVREGRCSVPGVKKARRR